MKALERKGASFFTDVEALVPSDTIFSGKLYPGIQQSVTVPSGANYAVFVADNIVFVSYDSAMSSTESGVVQGGGELNPKIRSVKTVSTLYLLSPETTYMSIAFYE